MTHSLYRASSHEPCQWRQSRRTPDAHANAMSLYLVTRDHVASQFISAKTRLTVMNTGPTPHYTAHTLHLVTELRFFGADGVIPVPREKCRSCTVDESCSLRPAVIRSGWLDAKIRELSREIRTWRLKIPHTNEFRVDPNAWKVRSKHKKVQTNAYLFWTDTQYAKFRGNPLCQATKRHLNR